MTTIEMVCLACSRKRGELCVAGIDLRSKQWVRLVGCPSGSALSKRYVSYEDRSVVKTLDRVRVPVLDRAPLSFQPENWVIDKEQWWVKEGEYTSAQLADFCSPPAPIFGNCADSLTPLEVSRMSPSHSLLLIKPNNVTFEIRPNIHGKFRARALFSFDDCYYDLALTDIVWEREIRRRGEKHWSPPYEFYFTISLGEWFQGRHYKLVAGVLRVDDAIWLDLANDHRVFNSDDEFPF